MLVPNLSDAPIGSIDQSIVQKKNQFYNQSILANLNMWQEGDLDSRFYVGEQTLLYDLYGNLPAARRKRFNFNMSKAYIDSETGYQRRQRKSSIITPIENGAQETADQFTKLFMWLYQKEMMLETISDAFEMACITGMSFLESYMDWRTDPVNGDIKMEALPYNTFVVDPFFRQPDMSDCNGILRRTYKTKADIASLLPNSVSILNGIQGSTYPSRDGKFQYMSENLNMTSSDRIIFDEWYYRDYREQAMLCDNETGETMEWTGDDKILDQYLATYPSVTVVKQMVPTVCQALFVEDRCVYNGSNPLGLDEYPMVPVFYCYRPELPYFSLRISGLQRQLRDVQYLFTRRHLIDLDVAESQMTTGYIYKPTSMVNPDDIYEQAGQGKGIALLKNAEMTDVIKIPPPTMPQMELAKNLESLFSKISGISDIMLGSQVNSQSSGYLEQIRMSAGLTTQQGVFDHLDRAQKIVGRQHLKLMQTNWTPGKVKRIIHEEPTQEFYSKNFGKYDCVVEEGLNTSTQKQLQFAAYLQLHQVLGDFIPAKAWLDCITVPNKNELIKNIEENQQQQSQMAQQRAQVELMELKSRAELAQARAKADTGLFLERTSRVQENQAAAEERKHEAVKNDYVALLNMIKAVKEINTIDIEQLEKLLTMRNVVVNQEAQNVTHPTGLQQLALANNEGVGNEKEAA